MNSGRSYLITAVTAAASHCYSFMKSSCVDARELRPFCYMALCYTRIEDERDRYSMFFIQPQKLFLSFLISREDVFLESRKNRLDLNKISFQKTCLSKPGQYSTCTFVISRTTNARCLDPKFLLHLLLLLFYEKIRKND